MATKLYIEEIDYLFSRSRKCYTDYFFERNDTNKRRCNDVLSRLLNRFNAYQKVHGRFNDEVVEGYLESDGRYIKVCESVLNRQFKFISEFRSAMDTFINDNDLTNEYLKRYDGIDNRELQGEDLMLVLQIKYIICYNWLENIVNEFADSYRRLMPVRDPNSSYQKSFNYIKLDYGIKNDTAIGIMYEELRGAYIDSTLDEFKCHFMEGSLFDKKIRFVGSNANLVNLFFGVVVMELEGLRILNTSKIEVILTHFENRDGIAYNYKSIESQSQKPIKKPREFEKIKILLKRLKGL